MKNYQEDEPNAKFFKHYDFNCTFPGTGPLYIKAYDYDELFGDDLIGETEIDLEDRYFSEDWKSVNNKPIEVRQLFIPSSDCSQGAVRLWVEIVPTGKSSAMTTYNIAPRAPQPYQIQAVVWDTKKCISDESGGLIDMFCRSYFDPEHAINTDTHWRAQNGKGSFNWRSLFDENFPMKNPSWTVQVWDHDIIRANKLIGEAQLDLSAPIEDCQLTNRPLTLNKKYYEDYWQKKLGDDMKLEWHDDTSFFIPIKGDPKKTG